MRLGANMRWHMLLGMRSTSSVGCLTMTSILLQGYGRVGGSSAVGVVWRVSSRWHMMSAAVLMAAVVFWSSVVARSRLRRIWHNLHTSWDRSCRGAAASGVGRSGWATKALIELLQKRATDVVGGNVDGICNAHHDQGSLA
jgi:hypothetical protein